MQCNVILQFVEIVPKTIILTLFQFLPQWFFSLFLNISLVCCTLVRSNINITLCKT